MPFLDENGLEYFYNNYVPTKELVWENASPTSTTPAFCLSLGKMSPDTGFEPACYDGVEIIYYDYLPTTVADFFPTLQNYQSIMPTNRANTIRSSGFIPNNQPF